VKVKRMEDDVTTTITKPSETIFIIYLILCKHALCIKFIHLKEGNLQCLQFI